MLTLVVLLKAIIEIAGLTLLGQGVLAILAGPGRDQNLFYGVLRTITSPLMKLTRTFTPRFIADRHIPFVAFFLLAGIWLALTVEKVVLCAEQPQHAACLKVMQHKADSERTQIPDQRQ